MDATTYFLLAALLALVFIGVEIAICLGTISILALMISTADAEVTLNFLGSTGYEVLRDYLFAVIPLFILMGAFFWLWTWFWPTGALSQQMPKRTPISSGRWIGA